MRVSFGPGLTVLEGANGEGKTSLLEAVAWVARRRSFRGVPDHALVRAGAQTAVLRAELTEGERRVTVAAELRAQGGARVLVNGQVPRRRRDAMNLLRVTMFGPDDLQLVKGGPAERRGYLDELLASLSPRYERARADYARVLDQRNALLKSGLAGPDARSTLAVFDEQLVRAGAEVVRGRLGLAERLLPELQAAYCGLASAGEVGAVYRAEWWPQRELTAADRERVEEQLVEAVEAQRAREIERRVTLVGPHRDEWHLTIDGLDARSHASQGEQRTLALALRLAGHLTAREITGATPVLLLDDVFSELDDARSAALVARLPRGQTLLTTASHIPRAVEPERVLRLRGHAIVEGA